MFSIRRLFGTLFSMMFLFCSCSVESQLASTEDHNDASRSSADSSLEDLRWEIVKIDGNDIDGSSESHYLIFDSAKSELEAKANCNTILRPYTLSDASAIEILEGITSLMACMDDTENQLQDALDKASSFEINEDALIIREGSNKLIELKLAE